MRPKSALRLLCEDYCKQYPKLPSLTLAEKIVKENRVLVAGKTGETIRRTYVNVIRGKNGKKLRNQTKDKSLYQEKTYDTRNHKPYKEEINPVAKILILDIETAPLRAYVWNVWQQNISPDQIESDWFILTWSAKWLFDKKVYSGKINAAEVLKEDDSRIIKGIWELINQADIVIAHNGDKFDIPKLNTRFLIHGLMPPMPYQSIDTLRHIRRQFGFSHNKLDYVNKQLHLRRKVEHEGMPLWVACMKGDKKALDKMEEYNIGDVKILEDTYLNIRPWIKPHPNCGLFILDEHQHHCPSCTSTDLIDEGKMYYTTVNAYEQFRCNNCGAISRKRKGKPTVKEKRYLLSSVPR